MKKLSEMSKEEIEEIANERFLPVMAMELPAQSFVIPVTPKLCEVTNILHEALQAYIKEHFNESD